MYYPVRTPQWIQRWFPSYCWRIEPNEEKILYLTFDDGPIPTITPWVLEQLAIYNAQATFFCVGANVEKHPEIYRQVIEQGHLVGNHTFNHMNGWKASTKDYIKNVEACQKYVSSRFFRPPYGRLKPKQASLLKKQYTIVMWDVIAGDFDPSISSEQCWLNIKNNVSDGSILVLHDSKKAWKHLEYVLPKVLAHYASLGFTFARLG